jgi:hypothetical protein
LGEVTTRMGSRIKNLGFSELPIVGHPFFWKMFFSRICFGNPSLNFWRSVSVRNLCVDEVQFKILIPVARSLKNLLAAGV